MPKINETQNILNKNINIVISNIDCDTLMSFKSLPVKNAIVISAPKESSQSILTDDAPQYAILMTDDEGSPGVLTKHINKLGFDESNSELKLNVDNHSLIVNSSNQVAINTTFLESFLVSYDINGMQLKLNELERKLNEIISSGSITTPPALEDQTPTLCINDYNTEINENETLPFTNSSIMYLILNDVHYADDEQPSVVVSQYPTSSLTIDGPATNI